MEGCHSYLKWTAERCLSTRTIDPRPVLSCSLHRTGHYHALVAWSLMLESSGMLGDSSRQVSRCGQLQAALATAQLTSCHAATLRYVNPAASSPTQRCPQLSHRLTKCRTAESDRTFTLSCIAVVGRECGWVAVTSAVDLIPRPPQSPLVVAERKKECWTRRETFWICVSALAKPRCGQRDSRIAKGDPR